MTNEKAKVLFLDIETKPILAYVWRLWDQNIGLNQIVEPGGTICIGAKWMGEKETMFFSEWEDGHYNMIAAMHDLLMEADGVVTYNGDKFDLPKLNGNFVYHKLPPIPPLTSIDIYKTVRGLGLDSGKLDFVGPFLELGSKVKHEGFSLWTKTMAGDTKAQKRMEKYCIQDVKLLEKVYKRLRPYVKNHPNLSLDVEKGGECGACGSHDIQKRGFRRTKHFQIQRMRCNNCGSWSDGPRRKFGTKARSKA